MLLLATGAGFKNSCRANNAAEAFWNKGGDLTSARRLAEQRHGIQSQAVSHRRAWASGGGVSVLFWISSDVFFRFRLIRKVWNHSTSKVLLKHHLIKQALNRVYLVFFVNQTRHLCVITLSHTHLKSPHHPCQLPWQSTEPEIYVDADKSGKGAFPSKPDVHVMQRCSLPREKVMKVCSIEEERWDEAETEKFSVSLPEMNWSYSRHIRPTSEPPATGCCENAESQSGRSHFDRGKSK